MVIETEKEVALALLGFLIATGMTLWLYQIDFQGLGHLINWSKTVSCCLE
jgi:thiosulfate dehydrogenase [quinone] small subunit